MSVMTITILAGAIKWNRPSMIFWLIFQSLVTHVTGCILRIDPSYNNRYGSSKNSTKTRSLHNTLLVKLHSVLIYSNIMELIVGFNLLSYFHFTSYTVTV